MLCRVANFLPERKVHGATSPIPSKVSAVAPPRATSSAKYTRLPSPSLLTFAIFPAKRHLSSLRAAFLRSEKGRKSRGVFCVTWLKQKQLEKSSFNYASAYFFISARKPCDSNYFTFAFSTISTKRSSVTPPISLTEPKFRYIQLAMQISRIEAALISAGHRYDER